MSAAYLYAANVGSDLSEVSFKERLDSLEACIPSICRRWRADILSGKAHGCCAALPDPQKAYLEPDLRVSNSNRHVVHHHRQLEASATYSNLQAPHADLACHASCWRGSMAQVINNHTRFWQRQFPFCLPELTERAAEAT